MKRLGRPPYSIDGLVEGPQLSEMIHLVGHEIDNPLTAIISMAAVIERFAPTNDSPEFRTEKLPSYSRAISNEAWRISHLVEKVVMTLSRRELSPSPCDLVGTLQAALTSVQEDSTLAGVPIGFRTPGGSAIVSAEPYQLSFLLKELLRNALTAAHAANNAKVHLSIDAGDEWVALTIANDKIEASSRELSDLFLPFVSETALPNRAGLGLTAAWAVAERLGGELELSEEADEAGIHFSTRLRLRPAQGSHRSKSSSAVDAPEAPDEPTSPVAPVILIVEDEPTVASAIKKILELGLSTVSPDCRCLSGTECLEFLRSGKPASAIFCDVNLKDTNGFAIFQQITESFPQLAARFAFLTGDSRREETIRRLNRTGRPYLMKPFEPGELIELAKSLALRPVQPMPPKSTKQG
ncbi:MAG: hybrid sensor histidine kinase/response regulator [Bdellovibrionales bacterium]|nr:hybrid sensor histidine kinase/response regulator [Bdellovibrionales bacterium]